MTKEQVVTLLEVATHKAGGQTAFAEANNISLSYVSDVLKGRREPGQRILDALGLELVKDYRRVKA